MQLGPDYLDRRRLVDNGPALEHAYALTKYGAQGKTLDRAYPLLDGESSMEQELVALSRGREIAYVYAVAASELTDEDLGPGRREVTDPLQDIRAAIEATGNEYAAAEVEARRLINSYEPGELAAERAALQAAIRRGDPALRRRDHLDREAERAEKSIAYLASERTAAEAAGVPTGEVKRLADAEELWGADLSRIVAEREALPGAEPRASFLLPASPADRLRAVLIEQRIDLLVTRQIEADRLEVSELTYKTLGAYPHSDADKSLAWHQGARALYTYRYRNRVDDKAAPLGAKAPRGAAARAERARAQRRLARSAERSVDRELVLGR